MEKGIEQLKNDVLVLLCAATDLDTAINRVLEMIGSYFHVDRAYIFENTEDDTACVNTFEWCNEGITPEIQNLQYLSYEHDLGFDWMDNYNEEGLFFCPQIKELPPKQRNVLEPQGIFSMLHCAILERGQFKGYIGFDNCDDHLVGWESDRDAVDTLVYSSRLLSLYLLEYRNKSRLIEMVKAEETKQQALQKALDEVVRSSKIIGHVADIDYDYIMVVEMATDQYRLYSNKQDLSMDDVQRTGCYSEMIRRYAEKYIHPQDIAVATDQMGTAYIARQLEGKKTYTTQARLMEPGGRVRYKQAKFAFLDEEHTALLVTRTDITALMQKAETEKQILEKALSDAEHANFAKTDFLARMSHDIRTPLNAIIGLTALTLDEPDLTPAVRENLANIRGSGDFLLGLVNDVLDMSKIEAGAVKLNCKPYLYTDFIAKLKTMFTPQCNAKNIEFDFADVKVNSTIMADKLRMDQIFFNLLSNAVKFTPEGGKISYRTENLQLDEDAVECDYIVADTGIGMSEKFLAHVFDPFEQEDTGYSANLKGSGLGLSIAKSLTELMGGTIRIESKLDHGTTVTVHLRFELCKDQNVDEATGDHTVPEAIDAVLRGARVLLVEDHPLNAQIARRLLEKKKIAVMHASNGAEAVALFDGAAPNAFDAVLMDIRMPVMDGLEATRAIRALPREDAKTVPILAMSANAYEEDVEKSLAAGMNAHLAKPVEPQALYQTLAHYLEKK